MRYIFADCCALSGSGHATAAPQSSVMNSRRFRIASDPRRAKTTLEDIQLMRFSQEVAERFYNRLVKAECG
jgi:hypothetical protein